MRRVRPDGDRADYGIVTRVIGVIIAALAAALLAGCGSSADGQSRGSTVIALDRSIGGVSLRERRSHVDRELGHGSVLAKSDQRPPEPRFHFERVLYANGLEVGYVSRGTTPRSLGNGRVGYLLTRSPSFRTREGVHVGSSRAALRTIKGVICGNLLHLDCQHGGQVHNQPGTFFKLSGPGGRGIIVRIAIALSD
jgi:hypothetical protein